MCQRCTFLEGRWGSAVGDLALPLGAKFSEALFPPFKIDHKTPKIPPDMYKPLRKQNAKTPPLNHPSKWPLWAYTWKLSSNSKNKQTKQKQCTVTREFAKELLVYQFISV